MSSDETQHRNPQTPSNVQLDAAVAKLPQTAADTLARDNAIRAAQGKRSQELADAFPLGAPVPGATPARMDDGTRVENPDKEGK